MSDDKQRAGDGGYSILRQPLDWDPDADPVFDAPKSLDEKTGSLQADSDWWSQKTESNNARRQSQTSQQQQPQRTKTPYVSKKPKPVETVADLDLFQRTLDTLDFPIVLNALQDSCATVPGRDFVADAMRMTNRRTTKGSNTNSNKSNEKKIGKKKIPKQLLRAYQPLTASSYEGLQERYAAVEEMSWIMNGVLSPDEASFRNKKGYKEALGQPPTRGMNLDLKSILALADEGQVLEGPEILEVVTIMDVLEDIQLWGKGLVAVESLDFVELPKMTDCITVNGTLQELLHNAFDNQGRLSGSTFPKIGQLRATVKALKSDILGTLESLLSIPSISSKLALESGGAAYSEVNGRIVIPIDAKYGKASVGIIHDTSRSGKTLYVEPTEIVASTNEMRQAEVELRTEEARIWRLLTEEILRERVFLEASVAAAGQLDVTVARVLLGKTLQGVIPEVRDEGVISLRNARHPVLLLREIDNVVGSDIDLGSDGNQGLVLTGPNSGGKTVILKLLGLVALMARNGIPVPADRRSDEDEYVGWKSSDGDDPDDYVPRVDFFDPILADIGDIQSVGGDLSTFSGHMLVCREVLAESGKDALVLMDELGSGTDPNQGVAIAQALLEAIVDTGSRVAITTHYMQLKQLAAADNRFAVAGMQFVNGRPTYKLLPGTVGESFALAVAERLELPPSVLERANELLDSETRQMGDLIRELEDQKSMIDLQAKEMEDQKKEMDQLEMQLRTQKFRLEEKQLSARRDEAKKFAKMLEEKEQILEDVLEKLKSDPSRRILAKSWDDIKFVKRDALQEAENVPSVLQAKAKQSRQIRQVAAELVPLDEMREKPTLKPGDKLMVCQQGPFFAKEATVVTAGKKPEVKIGNMQIRMKLADLALPNTTVKPKVSTVDQTKSKQKARMNKAVERALEAEMSSGGDSQMNNKKPVAVKANSVSIRTASNTVDVRGKNIDDAESMIMDKFDSAIMSNRSVVYILHGYGPQGVLRNKVRNWLKQQKTLVKSFGPASPADGGDSFTKVELE